MWWSVLTKPLLCTEHCQKSSFAQFFWFKNLCYNIFTLLENKWKSMPLCRFNMQKSIEIGSTLRYLCLSSIAIVMLMRLVFSLYFGGLACLICTLDIFTCLKNIKRHRSLENVLIKCRNKTCGISVVSRSKW